MMTYDSGANGHYISEKDLRKAGLPIFWPSTRRVGVADGGTSTAKFVTQLPFQKISHTADATTRAMANTTTIQTGSEGTAISQQCLQSIFN